MVTLALWNQDYCLTSLDCATTGEQNFALTEGLIRETLQIQMWVNIGVINKASQEQKAEVTPHGNMESQWQTLRPKWYPLMQGSWDVQTKLCQVLEQSFPLWLGTEMEKRGCLGLLVHQSKNMKKIWQPIHVMEHRLLILPSFVMKREQETTTLIG